MAKRNQALAKNDEVTASGVRKARRRADVHALRQANQNLVLEALRSNAAEDALREVAEFRERLIGIIGHDLRNPLNAVLMASGLLVSGGELTETDRKLATHILESGRRMRRIIGAVLEFTRARLGGGIELHLAAADLSAVCEQIANELRIGSAASIEVRVRGDVVGNWDAVRVGEAVSNLAGNAVEHADPGTPVVIDVRDAGEGIVTIAVTNHGPDIPPADVSTLFDPFKRGRGKDDRDQAHLGLGLFIAREIAHSHGGTLDVDSAGGTSTFTMCLPR